MFFFAALNFGAISGRFSPGLAMAKLRRDVKLPGGYSRLVTLLPSLTAPPRLTRLTPDEAPPRLEFGPIFGRCCSSSAAWFSVVVAHLRPSLANFGQKGPKSTWNRLLLSGVAWCVWRCGEGVCGRKSGHNSRHTKGRRWKSGDFFSRSRCRNERQVNRDRENGVMSDDEKGLFTGGISRISRISWKWSDSPWVSTVWWFSKFSRISKFSRLSRKCTFLKRPLFQKTPSKFGFCQRTNARNIPAISTRKCLCQKLITHVQLLVNFLPAGFCTRGEKQYEIARARFCTQSWSALGQLLANSPSHGKLQGSSLQQSSGNTR